MDEHTAQAGDIVLSAMLLDLISPSVSAESLGNGSGEYHKLLSLGDGLPAGEPAHKPAIPSVADFEIMSRFYPATIVNQELSGEFRQILNLFISLPTVRTEDQLAIFMRSVFTLQDQYGGLLNRVDFGDKGSNLLLFWGVPVAYENDVARTLNFILDSLFKKSKGINVFQLNFVIW